MSAVMARGASRAASVDSRPVPRRAVLRALPAVLERRIDPAAAAIGDAVLELRVRASGGGPETRFRLDVRAEATTVTRGPAPDAAAWFSISLGDMIQLVGGSVSMWDLLAQGRLDLGGEAFTAMRIPGLLRL